MHIFKFQFIGLLRNAPKGPLVQRGLANCRFQAIWLGDCRFLQSLRPKSKILATSLYTREEKRCALHLPAKFQFIPLQNQAHQALGALIDDALQRHSEFTPYLLGKLQQLGR